ncbi:hypothetical protein, partial [Rhabdaerophilum sp.]|uniref:hypothetical protein n=1 Tax=Rhabdaerophilum sp. TaxID=2717341 RepID=UPI0038D37D93
KYNYLIECKAAKLTIKQQYSSFFDERSAQFDELAKGVLQLWRQVSFYSETDNMYPVLLTYDRWLFLNELDREHLYKRARELAGDSLEHLSYQGNVVLCTIESLEICLSVCDADQLSQLFTLALEDECNGYIVSVLLNRVVPEYSKSDRKLSLSLSDFGAEWDFGKRS